MGLLVIRVSDDDPVAMLPYTSLLHVYYCSLNSKSYMQYLMMIKQCHLFQVPATSLYKLYTALNVRLKVEWQI